MNKDPNRSDLLNLSDTELGRLARQFIAGVDDWANKQWASRAQTVVGLAFMATAQLVKQAHDCDAGELKMTLNDVTLEGQSAGDWRINVKRIKAPKPLKTGADAEPPR
jgi:hypothetical protein